MKSIVWTIDQIIFHGKLKHLYSEHIAEKRLFNFRLDHYGFAFLAQYPKNSKSILNELCDHYGSDKGELTPSNNPYPWPSHNYADVYEMLFQSGRHNIDLLIECGIGTNNPELSSSMGANGKPGASLRVWRDYFPNAQILGIDIDAKTLFSEERINTFHCDQTDPTSIRRFLENAKVGPATVDIIIDDGLHTYSAGKTLFESLAQYLKADGIYVIEDVLSEDSLEYKTYFSKLDSQYHAKFISLKSPYRKWAGSNRMILITQKQLIPNVQQSEAGNCEY
jgi:hypothetical protein